MARIVSPTSKTRLFRLRFDALQLPFGQVDVERIPDVLRWPLRRSDTRSELSRIRYVDGNHEQERKRRVQRYGAVPLALRGRHARIL